MNPSYPDTIRDEDDYTRKYYMDALNSAFGSGLSRQNIDIYYPRVQNYLHPQELKGDGSSNPPLPAKSFFFDQQHQKLDPEHTNGPPPADDDFYATILTNPDYTPGRYYPRYTKHQMLYDLHEDPPGYRDPVLDRKETKIAHFPLEIRRGLV